MTEFTHNDSFIRKTFPVSLSELWELHRISDLMKERKITNDAASEIVKAEIEAGLCPYLPSKQIKSTSK